jgi:hypothetical protein
MRGTAVKNIKRILHIDPSYQVVYFIFGERTIIRSTVPLKTAIRLLRDNEEFDLIISEPQEMAILNSGWSKKSEEVSPLKEETEGGLGHSLLLL